MRADAPTRTRRSGFAPLCAKYWALLCLALGCLNPSPDDQPSERQPVPSAPADTATGGTQTPSSNGSNNTQSDPDDLSEPPPMGDTDQSASNPGGGADAGAPLPDAGPDADADAGVP